MTSRFFSFLFIGCAVFICGCNPDTSNNSTQPSAVVSIYALSPDAPNLNLFLNDNNIAASIPFGSYTIYNPVTAGNAKLVAQTSSQNVVADSSFAIVAGGIYSIFLVDSFSKIKPVYVKDNVVATTDSVYLRFFNFSPGSPAVDIYSYSDSSNQKTIWKNRIFTNIIADSVNQFTGCKTGTYNFVVLRSNSTDTLAKFYEKDLNTAGNYSLLLEGMYKSASGDTTLQLGVRLH